MREKGARKGRASGGGVAAEVEFDGTGFVAGRKEAAELG